jgi:MSHA pilin protein MshB
MQHTSVKKQRGFTLIELVVVIAILAILAAFALPRFAQLSEQAHQSSIRATAGALSAGVALVKAQWVTNGTTGEVTAVEGFGNDNVAVNGDGWPTSTNGTTGAPNANRCLQVWQGVLQSNAPVAATTEAADTEYLVGLSGDDCEYEYLPDEQGSTIVYDTDSGDIITTIN